MYGGGVKPVINGGGTVEDTVLLKNQEYWEIENLEITNTGAQRAERRGVHVTLEDYGEAHHIYIRGLTIHDVNGVDSVKTNGGIDYTSAGAKKPSRFIDLRIENNEIYRVDRSGIFGWSDSWIRSKWFPSLGVVLRGNQLHDIGGDGIPPVPIRRKKEVYHAVWPGEAAFAKLLNRRLRPTAILCSNDMTAIGVMRKCYSEKIAVPQELSVIGFDNIHLSQYILPPLTTIEMSQTELGRLAFQALLQEVRREIPNPEGTEYVLKTSFMLRHSTALNPGKGGS
jgi:hypothetical protein